MFTRYNIDRFTALVASGLVMTVTIVIGSLAHAVTNLQIVA